MTGMTGLLKEVKLAEVSIKESESAECINGRLTESVKMNVLKLSTGNALSGLLSALI